LVFAFGQRDKNLCPVIPCPQKLIKEKSIIQVAVCLPRLQKIFSHRGYLFLKAPPALGYFFKKAHAFILKGGGRGGGGELGFFEGGGDPWVYFRINLFL